VGVDEDFADLLWCEDGHAHSPIVACSAMMEATST
jgi:hypothetical protein